MFTYLLHFTFGNNWLYRHRPQDLNVEFDVVRSYTNGRWSTGQSSTKHENNISVDPVASIPMVVTLFMELGGCYGNITLCPFWNMSLSILCALWWFLTSLLMCHLSSKKLLVDNVWYGDIYTCDYNVAIPFKCVSERSNPVTTLKMN